MFYDVTLMCNVLKVFMLLKEYVLIMCLMFTVMRAATLNFVVF